jgi:hypothetical protein
MEGWQSNIEKFCKHYNIPLEYLSDTLREPKVIPMIRGKAFEFTVLERLKNILSINNWEVKKDIMNAQLGSHDEDVSIIYKPTSKRLSVECKLAGKGRFKKSKDGNYIINVKCMRSRTMGDIVVQRLAPQLGISVESLTLHNDQYRETDFDLVVSSIGNAFYETDDDGLFIWDPSSTGIEFLRKLFTVNDSDLLQELAFHKMYVALSKDLAVGNGYQTCVRRGCDKDAPCGFIPNYPPIIFDQHSLLPINGWVPIESIESLLKKIV